LAGDPPCLPPLYRAIAIRDNFSLHHLNCGIAGTVMRGGGGAATLGALRIPLGSVLLSALLSAPAFARPPAGFPVAAEPPPRAPPPPPRANEAAGMAKTMNNAIATFTEVFDMG
jgi:hypothetical protein